MSDKIIEIEVLRYRPEQDAEPVWQSYKVPFEPEWVVLDALNYVKDHLDGTLSYRWSCHMGVCGSCGMMVNGVPVLSCHVFVKDYYPARIRVEPLAHFPIERDLVVTLDDFMNKLQRVKPYLIPKNDKPVSEGEFLQSPAELVKYKQYTLCINCTLCYSACPQVGLNPDFIGPAALALAHRYNADSRDGGQQLRFDEIFTHEGIWECTFVGECSVVCPKHVDPAGAIQQTKIEATKDFFKSLLMPWGNK